MAVLALLLHPLKKSLQPIRNQHVIKIYFLLISFENFKSNFVKIKKDLVANTQILLPRSHHKRVVHRYASDGVDPFGSEFPRLFVEGAFGNM